MDAQFMSELEKLRAALAQIAEEASATINGSDYPDDHGEQLVCTPKSLPKRLVMAAAKTAIEINPVNAPMIGPLAEMAADMVLDPQRIAVLTSKYWGPTSRRLTVSFLDNPPADLRARIISHMNAW